VFSEAEPRGQCVTGQSPVTRYEGFLRRYLAKQKKAAMKKIVLSIVVLGLLSGNAGSQQPAATVPLKVHLIGVGGGYKPDVSLREFKKVLEERYRVDCTASLGNNTKKLDNFDPVKSADVLVIFSHRLNLPEEQMAVLRDHWEKGKPIVALRTASHGFQAADNEIFDKKVLGGDYKGYGSGPFKAIAAKDQAEHPVLKGVEPITSKSYYNNGKLAEDAVVLQVVESDKKTPQPVTWAHTYKGGRTIYTSMGVPEDFQDENFRRLLANAIFWTTQRDPEKMKK
jgi:type 1 glutamine amidotransferase